MDHTQCRITVFDRFHQNTYSKQIIDLIQCLILVDHLFINAEEMFHSSLYICLDLGIVHVLFDFRHDGLYIFLTGTLLLCNLGYQIIIDIRLQIFQRQIIQLDLYFRNTKTLCNGRIDVHGLSCFFLLLFRLHVFQSTHIVKPVRQLDEDNADIFCHCKEHFSQVLCLFIHFICGIAQLTQLGDSIYQQCHLITKFLCQVFCSHRCILYHIMKKTCCNTFLIKLQICQNNCHTKRVNDIRLTGFTHLSVMGLFCHLVCFFDHGDVRRWMIFGHALHQFLI